MKRNARKLREIQQQHIADAEALRAARSQSPDATPQQDPFGALPVRGRGLPGVVPVIAADPLGPFDDPVSYQAGRYPEEGVEHMMINGVDIELDDDDREEIAVWGTLNGQPIEDFDDWSDWA